LTAVNVYLLNLDAVQNIAANQII